MGHPFRFLSIQAQDFIEENATTTCFILRREFLSIQAQDFIEENGNDYLLHRWLAIPEHSSSGLH